MHGKCVEMKEMGCCRTEVRADDTPQIAAMAPVTDVQWVCVAYLPALTTSLHLAETTVRQLPNEHSPPGLLNAKTTVLRI